MLNDTSAEGVHVWAHWHQMYNSFDPLMIGQKETTCTMVWACGICVSQSEVCVVVAGGLSWGLVFGLSMLKYNFGRVSKVSRIYMR